MTQKILEEIEIEKAKFEEKFEDKIYPTSLLTWKQLKRFALRSRTIEAVESVTLIMPGRRLNGIVKELVKKDCPVIALQMYKDLNEKFIPRLKTGEKAKSHFDYMKGKK